MLRQASGIILKPTASGPLRVGVRRTCRRGLQTSASCRGESQHSGHRNPTVIVSAILLGSYAFYAGVKEIQNDASIGKEPKNTDPSLGPSSQIKDEENLHSLVWGSNRAKVLSPTSHSDATIRTPAVASWLDGVALRDLQFHEHHAACVDAKGDVYQWGDGYFGDLLVSGAGRHPSLTLKGKNIVQLQLTEDKVYALSASGHIYTFATKATDQILAAGAPTPSSDSWWGTGWLWGEEGTIDFAQLTPNEKLNWRERFTSIAAGKNHLLAMTSQGRAFGHPVNKGANSHGQLGFQRFSVPDPAANVLGQNAAHLHVNLIPKSLADPFWKASRSVRVTSDASPKDDLAAINDKDIRFCPGIYEIPVLRGVDVAQVAAGARSSFARTPSGRVLGWGANEYGQIGLGNNVAVDTIIVPTEVVLWGAVPANVNTTCTDVTAGGDLTAFVVDRDNSRDPVYTDLLMSGNGQYGGLGNNLFTTAQLNPSRVKTISGLKQYNEKTRQLDPIKPETITVSPTGHVVLAINSAADSLGVGGSDVLVWGRNFDSELGNGKKSSMALPQHLEVPEGERLMLMQRKAKEVKDLHGKVWKKGVNVEQKVAVGYGTTAVYWKISGPSSPSRR